MAKVDKSRSHVEPCAEIVVACKDHQGHTIQVRIAATFQRYEIGGGIEQGAFEPDTMEANA